MIAKDDAMTSSLHTTNYRNAFIQVADDCPVGVGTVPPVCAEKPSIAGLQYGMIARAPYAYTSDDVIFATSAAGRALDADASPEQRRSARDAFFSKGQACMRASPLAKRYGWGIHADAEGRIAIYGVKSERYCELACDPKIKQLKAMRSKRV
jgi:hypothetical protein